MKLRWCTLTDWKNFKKTTTLQYWHEDSYWKDIPVVEYDDEEYDPEEE